MSYDQRLSDTLRECDTLRRQLADRDAVIARLAASESNSLRRALALIDGRDKVIQQLVQALERRSCVAINGEVSDAEAALAAARRVMAP